MPRPTLLIVVLALLLPGALCRAQTTKSSSNDEQFVAEVTSGGMLEVRLSQYASDNAKSKDVKAFAEDMVGDHSDANDDLKQVASMQSIERPKQLNGEDQATLDRLEKLKGEAFDKAYVAQMIADHKKTIAAFEAEISDGKNSYVKTFAELVLPKLKHHLEMAQALQQNS